MSDVEDLGAQGNLSRRVLREMDTLGCLQNYLRGSPHAAFFSVFEWEPPQI